MEGRRLGDVRAASGKCPPNVRLRYGKKYGMISSVKEAKGRRFRKEAAFLMGLGDVEGRGRRGHGLRAMRGRAPRARGA